MGCPTGKTEYASERRANRALRHPKLQTQGRMHAYKCETCPAWHLGHATYIGGGWVDKPPATGLKRPRDVFTGFIVVGQHQVVFGNVCLNYGQPRYPADQVAAASTLGLPESLVRELAFDDASHTAVAAEALLDATPEELDQIKKAWLAQTSRATHPKNGA